MLSPPPASLPPSALLRHSRRTGRGWTSDLHGGGRRWCRKPEDLPRNPRGFALAAAGHAAGLPAVDGLPVASFARLRHGPQRAAGLDEFLRGPARRCGPRRVQEEGPEGIRQRSSITGRHDRSGRGSPDEVRRPRSIGADDRPAAIPSRAVMGKLSNRLVAPRGLSIFPPLPARPRPGAVGKLRRSSQDCRRRKLLRTAPRSPPAAPSRTGATPALPPSRKDGPRRQGARMGSRSRAPRPPQLAWAP